MYHPPPPPLAVALRTVRTPICPAVIGGPLTTVTMGGPLGALSPLTITVTLKLVPRLLDELHSSG